LTDDFHAKGSEVAAGQWPLWLLGRRASNLRTTDLLADGSRAKGSEVAGGQWLLWLAGR
jgi:hypothetical protein